MRPSLFLLALLLLSFPCILLDQKVHYGVSRNFSAQAWSGINVVNSWADREECGLFDMEGRLISDGPGGFCRFAKNGEVVATIRQEVTRFDRQGVHWRHKGKIHHELVLSSDGERSYHLESEFSTGPDPKLRSDVLVALDRGGQVAFRWSTEGQIKAMEKLAGIKFREVENWDRQHQAIHEFTHFNAIDIIEPTPLMSQSPFFQPGNLLITCFETSKIWIFDIKSKKMVHWLSPFSEKAGLHSARQLPSGNILVFVNSFPGNWPARVPSGVVEFDPINNKILWQFILDPERFDSSIRFGHAQRLKNGNTLITASGDEGRAIEVTSAGQVVFSWQNPKRNAKTGRPLTTYRVERIEAEMIPDWILRGNW